MGGFNRSIREATDGDALEIAALWLRSRRATLGIPLASHTDDEVRDWFQEVVVPAGGVWVAGHGRALAGRMVLRGDWVEQLYVAPESQRQGHGSRLLQQAQSLRSELALWTFAANTHARAFYERHGFQADGLVTSDNEERTPALCYRWIRPVQ